LKIPAGVPREHWEIAAYDLETGCFIHESRRLAVNNHCPTTTNNADGSVDVYFGSTLTGKEGNWIYTAPNRPWFALFRVFDSESAADSWLLGDIEKID
jgi:hypothetical protein